MISMIVKNSAKYNDICLSLATLELRSLVHTVNAIVTQEVAVVVKTHYGWVPKSWFICIQELLCQWTFSWGVVQIAEAWIKRAMMHIASLHCLSLLDCNSLPAIVGLLVPEFCCVITNMLIYFFSLRWLFLFLSTCTSVLFNA